MDILHPGDVEANGLRFQEAIAKTQPFEAELRFRRHDGAWRWHLVRSLPQQNADGSVKQWIGTAIDITERKEAEIALRDNEQRFRAIFNHQFQFSGLLTPEGKVLDMSESALRNAGLPRQEVVGRDFLALPFFARIPETQDHWRRQFAEALAEDHSSRVEAPYHALDGSLHYAINTVTALRDEAGAVKFLLAEGIDITERKQAEEALQAANAQLDAIFDTAPIGLAVFNRDLEYTRVNQRLAEFNGLPGEAHLGRRPDQLLPNLQGIDAIVDRWRRIIATGEPWLDIEVEGATPAAPGITRTWIENFYPIRINEKIEGLAAIVMEITERKQIEKALRTSERRLSLASEAGKLGVHEFDVLARRAIWSQSLWRLFGLEGEGEASFETAISTIYPEDRDRVQSEMAEILRKPGPYQMEFRVKRPDGTVLWVLDRGEAVGPVNESTGCVALVRGTILDISERKHAEEALRNAQRFAQGLIEAAPTLLYIYDLVERQNVFISPQIETMIGRSAQEISHLGSALVNTLFHPDDLPRIAAHHQAFWDQPESTARSVEYRMLHKDGSWRWLLSRDIVYERDTQGRALRILGSAQDITERKRHEEHQKLLLNELNHRVKNTLATIQSIASQTLRNSASLAEAKESFEARLMTLSKAHDVLTREKWESAPLAEIVAPLAPIGAAAQSGLRLRVQHCGFRLAMPWPLPWHCMSCAPMLSSTEHCRMRRARCSLNGL